MIADVSDEEGFFLLLERYSEQNRSMDYSLEKALERLAFHEEPIGNGGSYEMEPIAVPGVRRRLLAMTVAEDSKGRLARACLNSLDFMRDRHGSPLDEARHPDIMSGIPWPSPQPLQVASGQ